MQHQVGSNDNMYCHINLRNAKRRNIAIPSVWPTSSWSSTFPLVEEAVLAMLTELLLNYICHVAVINLSQLILPR